MPFFNVSTVQRISRESVYRIKAENIEEAKRQVSQGHGSLQETHDIPQGSKVANGAKVLIGPFHQPWDVEASIFEDDNLAYSIWSQTVQVTAYNQEQARTNATVFIQEAILAYQQASYPLLKFYGVTPSVLPEEVAA